jgi:protocatechuate 3,4-dioxygenase beta subunit
VGENIRQVNAGRRRKELRWFAPTRLAPAIALLAAVVVHGQSARPSVASPAGTGSIRGRVLAADTGAPVRHARIELEDGDHRMVLTVLADGEGQFAFTSVSAGMFTLAAAKPGYVRTLFVAQGDASGGRTNPASIRVAEGATVEGLEVYLAKAGAIAGRILDESGEPVIGASVTADSVGGGERISARGETDDLGQYRIGGLPAGRFVVSVDAPAAVLFSQTVFSRGPGARPGGRARIYYPGTDDASQAQPIEVLTSEQRTNVDFGVAFTQLTNDVTIGDAHAIGNVTLIGSDSGALAIVQPRADQPAERDATGEISGRVTRADGRPLPSAQVCLELAEGFQNGRGALADDDGRYAFTALRPGDYTIKASRRGYLEVEYGQIRAFERGAEIKLSVGQKRGRVDVSLPRYGTIAGRVLDENGEPIEGARVSALQIRFTAGRQQLIEAQAARKRTDDLGSYRLHDLQPGQYIVRAAFGDPSDHSRPPLDIPGYATTYFPGTPAPEAARLVTVGVSEDVSGLDFAMTRLPTARISGHAFTSSGESVKGGLSLVRSQRSGSIASTPVGPDRTFVPEGSFEFRNVPPGEYVIQATTGRQTLGAEGEFAAQYVVVNGTDVDGLVLRTSSGSSMSGRVTFEGDKPPRPHEIGLRPVAVDPDLNPRLDDDGPFGAGAAGFADVYDDWTFEIDGISGFRRLRLINAPAGWALKGIYQNGVDVTDQTFALGKPDQSIRDLQVVLTNQVTEIAGTVADANGGPARDCLVMAFPTDREARSYPSRFLDHSACQRDGSFVIRRLPPGEYLIAAIARRSNEMADEWQEPRLLELVAPGATRVVLSEGEKMSISPRLIAR